MHPCASGISPLAHVSGPSHTPACVPPRGRCVPLQRMDGGGVWQVRYVFRERDVRGPNGAVAGMERIPAPAHRDVAASIRKMSAAINAPVATEEEMQQNQEYLCLKAAMHTAVATLHCDRQPTTHGISPHGMQPLISGAKRASSRPMFVHAFRHVRSACCAAAYAPAHASPPPPASCYFMAVPAASPALVELLNAAEGRSCREGARRPVVLDRRAVCYAGGAARGGRRQRTPGTQARTLRPRRGIRAVASPANQGRAGIVRPPSWLESHHVPGASARAPRSACCT